jgi:hypothetical protein
VGAPLELSYVLPLKWADDRGWAELEAYLGRLAPDVAEVIVVDGSGEELFETHTAALEGVAAVLPPDPSYSFAMGKVNGVTTGVLAARCDRVLIADDDVRWELPELRRLAALLDEADLVRPQNYFEQLPWHARLDTGRTLINRVWTGDREFPVGDFPGTLGIRRDAFVATGGYDGDVMFENFELMRTIAAAGGRVVTPLDLYVRRLPPTTSHFVGQRVRQAYDDLGLPPRLAVELSIAPLALSALLRRRMRWIIAAAGAIAAVAEVGRRRAGGASRFPASSSLLAPLWVAERAVSIWLAVLSRVRRGGIPYAGMVVPRAVSPMGELRGRLAGTIVDDRLDEGAALGGDTPRVGTDPSLGAEPGDLVGPVAEGMDPGAATAADGDRAPA